MAKRNRGRDVHGILLLDKPLGLSSNQALQRVKWLYGASKAGHTGALDPQASGLLPLCFGDATKFSQLLLESDKGYETTASLGEVRSTGDAEGEVISTRPVPELDLDAIEAVLERFRGDVEQVPPLFSALKLDGKPLYELARKGMSAEEAAAIAERKRRVIRIMELQLNAFREGTELDLTVICSKGTYIRTLVEDIGEALGCGAWVSRLHRILTGPYRASQMVTLEHIEALHAAGDFAAMDALLMPMESAVPDWPIVDIDLTAAEKIIRGQAVDTGLDEVSSVQLWTLVSGRRCFIGVGAVKDGRIRPVRLLSVQLLQTFGIS